MKYSSVFSDLPLVGSHIVAGFCAASISTTSNYTAKDNSLMIPLYLALLPAFASAYTFNFTSIPQQCENLDISIAGSGKPPYSVTIIPFGPSPLENNTEVRRIFQTSFSGSSTSFNLPYPADSQFVAVVSRRPTLMPDRRHKAAI